MLKTVDQLNAIELIKVLMIGQSLREIGKIQGLIIIQQVEDEICRRAQQN